MNYKKYFDTVVMSFVILFIAIVIIIYINPVSETTITLLAPIATGVIGTVLGVILTNYYSVSREIRSDALKHDRDLFSKINELISEDFFDSHEYDKLINARCKICSTIDNNLYKIYTKEGYKYINKTVEHARISFCNAYYELNKFMGQHFFMPQGQHSEYTTLEPDLKPDYQKYSALLNTYRGLLQKFEEQFRDYRKSCKEQLLV